MELDNHPSEFSHFKILPCYRYQNERNKFIQFDDELYIATSWDESLKDSFMVIQKKFSSSQSAEEAIEIEENTDEGEMESQFMNELSISIEKSTKYKLHFFSSFVERSQSRVLFGDIVWLSLIERKSHLQYELEQTISFDFKEQSKENMIKPSNLEDLRGRSMEKHYELLQRRNQSLHFEEFQDKKTKNTIGMWIIEGETRMKGGLLLWDTKIRLRHLSTGLYFTLKQVLNSEGRKNLLLSMEKRVTEDSLFMLKSKNMENCNHLLPDSFFHLEHCKTAMSFGMDQENFLKAGSLNEKVLWKINIQENASQENMMRFIKAEAQEIWETRFLLSCLPIIRSGVKLIENVKFYLKNY